VVHRSYRIGEETIGVRTTSESFGAWMDEALSRYATSEEAEPRLSVVVSGGEEGGPSGKRFHILYDRLTRVLRTLDLPTVGRGLIEELERLQYPSRDDAIYLDASFVTFDGVPMLIGSYSATLLDRLGRRLDRAGVRLSLPRSSAVEARSGRVVSPVPMLEIPEGAIEQLNGHSAGNGRADRIVSDGPVSVGIVALPGIGEVNTFQRISPAHGLANLGSMTMNLHQLGRPALDGLLRMVRGAKSYTVSAVEPRGLLETLTEIVKA
jgi:hypothetical protein